MTTNLVSIHTLCKYVWVVEGGRQAPLDPISSAIPRGRVEALLRHGRGGRAIRPGWLVPGGGWLSSTSQYTV